MHSDAEDAYVLTTNCRSDSKRLGIEKLIRNYLFRIESFLLYILMRRTHSWNRNVVTVDFSKQG